MDNNLDNNVNEKDNEKKHIHSVLGASIFAVIFTACACVAFYFSTGDKKDLSFSSITLGFSPA